MCMQGTMRIQSQKIQLKNQKKTKRNYNEQNQKILKTNPNHSEYVGILSMRTYNRENSNYTVLAGRQ